MTGGKTKVDGCGVCAGNGTTCDLEVEEAATPDAVVNLKVTATSNLTSIIDGVVTGSGIDASTMKISLKSQLVLPLDMATLLPNSPGRLKFEADFIADAADRILQVDRSIVSIGSIKGGSVIVEMVVKGTAEAARTIAKVAGFENETFAGVNVSFVSEPVIAFAIDSAKLKSLGTDLTTALPKFNSLVAENKLAGIVSGQSVFASLVMTCPPGWFSNADGACERCPRGQEPDETQTGCVKCTMRVTASSQTWYSSKGAVCELCPAGKTPNM